MSALIYRYSPVRVYNSFPGSNKEVYLVKVGHDFPLSFQSRLLIILEKKERVTGVVGNESVGEKNH